MKILGDSRQRDSLAPIPTAYRDGLGNAPRPRLFRRTKVVTIQDAEACSARGAAISARFAGPYQFNCKAKRPIKPWKPSSILTSSESGQP